MGGTVAEVQIPSDEFVLEELMHSIEGLECEVERVVANTDGEIMPFLWVSAPSLDGIEDALNDDKTVDNVHLLANVDGEQLYEMDWVQRIDALVEILVEEEGTVLSASGNCNGWELRLLFADRNHLSRTHQYCQSNGLTFQIRSVYQLEEGRQGRFGLTDEQQTTLETAFKGGYYNIPRDTDLMALSEELEISHQAASERLRRAHRNLVENTVIVGTDNTE
jgi:predicted DNA binding protein